MRFADHLVGLLEQAGDGLTGLLQFSQNIRHEDTDFSDFFGYRVRGLGDVVDTGQYRRHFFSGCLYLIQDGGYGSADFGDFVDDRSNLFAGLLYLHKKVRGLCPRFADLIGNIANAQRQTKEAKRKERHCQKF